MELSTSSLTTIETATRLPDSLNCQFGGGAVREKFVFFQK